MSATPASVQNSDLSNPVALAAPGMSKEIGELVGAICGVMAKLTAIPKTPAKSGSGGGLPYEYLSEDAITATLRPLLAEAGLVIFPRGFQVVEREDYEAGKSNMTRLLTRQRFIIAHKSGQWMECETTGEAADSGDKGGNKCMTAAFKYMERQTFAINGGSDPDERHSDDVARTGRGYGQTGQQSRQTGQQSGNQSRNSQQQNTQQQNRGNQNAAAGGGQQGDPAFPGGTGTDERAGKCMAAIAAAATHEAINALIAQAKKVHWTTDQQNRIRRSAAAQHAALWSAEIAVAPNEEAVNAIQTASIGPLGAFPELGQLVTVKARQRNAEHAAARAAAEQVPDTGGASGDTPFSDVPVSEMEF